MLSNSADFIKRKYINMMLAGTVFAVSDVAMSIVDTLIVGNYFGEQGLSAVNIVLPLYEIVVFASCAIAIGSGILYSRASGNFDREKMNQLFGGGLLTSIAIGIIALLAFMAFGGFYIHSYHLSDTITNYINDFTSYYKFSFFLCPASVLLAQLVYEDGDEKLCAFASVFGLVEKIVLSIIFGKTMGLAGIGLATSVSIATELIVYSTHLFKESNTLHFRWYFSLKELIGALKYSVIDATSYLYMAIFQGTINWIIATQYGDRYIAVFSVVLVTIQMFVFFDGVGTAMEPMFNNYYVENNRLGEKKIIRYSYASAVALGVIFTVLFCCFARYLVMFVGISNPELIEMSVVAVRIVGLAAIFSSLNYMVSSYCLLTERFVVGTIITGSCQMVLPILLTLLLSQFMGIMGIWVSIALALFITCVGAILFIRKAETIRDKDSLQDLSNTRMYGLAISLDGVGALNDAIEEFLTSRNVSEIAKSRTRLVIEELLLLILEKNEKKTVNAECTVTIRDTIDIVIRDDGIIFNITDQDMEVDSLRTYVVASIMDMNRTKKNILTTGFNKNMLKINLE